MKIAITGASGNYGRSAISRLTEIVPACDLILISRNPARLDEYRGQGADCRRGDFDFPETLASAFNGAEKTLLISGMRVGKRVAQHQAAIDAARAVGVKHIVYTSILGVADGNPAIVTRDHGPTEELIKASGAAWTILRDAQYADAVTDVIAPNAINTGKWISSSSPGKMPFVSRDDCVNCAVAALTKDGCANKTYNITGPDLLSYREASELVAEVSGRPIEFVETDDDGLYAMFDAMGIPREPVDNLVINGNPWNSDDMVTFEAAIRGGWFEVASDDVEQLTGKRPKGLAGLLYERLSPNS